MRIVELDGRVDRPDPASAASPDDSPYGVPSEPVLLSPSTAVARRGPTSRWREARTARRTRALVHIDELRSLASSDAEALRAARNAGAKAAVAELGELLGPKYTLFLGYRNPLGVIDQLLLCPQGLVAMLSLHANATAHCHRDDWRADRFDNFEMFIGQFRMTADAGHSPSLQLNEVTDVLEERLYAADLEIGILRAVLLNHPRSRRGNYRKPTADIFTSTLDFVTWLRNLPVMLDSEELGEISGFIVESQRRQL